MQRSLLYVAAALLLVWSAAQAQTAPAASQPPSPQTGPKLAPGTVIGAELSKGIDAKKARVGQPVLAKALSDLRDPSGNVVIPRGTKLVGHVTEVKAASKQEPQSSLAILFDKAQAKHGQEIGLNAGIQALTGPPPSPAMQEGGPMGAPSPSAGGGGMGGGQPGMGPGGSGGARASGGAQPGQTGDMGGNMGGATPQPSGAAPSLNANSHGVIGIPNLTLSPQVSPTEGSVISSNHGNVKLDSGTLLVLRVIGQ